MNIALKRHLTIIANTAVAARLTDGIPRLYRWADSGKYPGSTPLISYKSLSANNF
jgi:hypothetical protein